jgi:drug/metabolite transporter (DMT)-like permease
MLYSVLNVAIKKCPLPCVVITLWENIIGALWLWGMTVCRPSDFVSTSTRSHKGWVLLQGIFATCGSLLFVISLKTIPLIQTIAMGFVNPLMAATFAVFFLGEKMTKARLQAITLGVLGGVMILVSKTSSTLWGYTTWAWEPLMANALFTATHIINKHILKQTSVLRVMRSMMTSIGLILSVVIGGHMAGLFQEPWLAKALGHVIIPQNPYHLLSISVVGILALAAHWCHYQALKRQDVVVLLPFGAIKLATTCLLGWLFFSEKPSFLLICGMIITGFALKRLSWSANRSHSPNPG